MRIFGIPVKVQFTPDMNDEIGFEDREALSQIEYTNAYITTEDADSEWEYEPEKKWKPAKQKWWQR